jgi:predicted ATPase
MPVKRSSRREPLLEREAELEALIGLARQASSGVGGVALVEGPAGIGKSALLDHAVELIVNEGHTASMARGGELERELPWGVVRDLFERLLSRFEPDERDTLFTGAAGLARGAL